MNKEEQWLLTEKHKGLKSAAFESDVALLNSGAPLAYLIGSIPFLGCMIHLDSHPLIPRTETEFWTEKAIQEIQASIPDAKEAGTPTFSILDLCAGSGAIGAAVAQTIPEVHITFGEIEKKHLATIGKNLEINNIDCIRYKVFQSDLFENITGTYDFILTNPPYIDPTLDRAEASVKIHEPDLALYGGTGGMECIQEIINQASEYLTDSGQLWIEHEPEQSGEIANLATTSNFNCSTKKDQYGVERYSVLVLQ